MRSSYSTPAGSKRTPKRDLDFGQDHLAAILSATTKHYAGRALPERECRDLVQAYRAAGYSQSMAEGTVKTMQQRRVASLVARTAHLIEQSEVRALTQKECVTLPAVAVFATGVWHKKHYTSFDLQQMSVDDNRVPVLENHGGAVIGYADRLAFDGEHLNADLHLPGEIVRRISNGQLHACSSEVTWRTDDVRLGYWLSAVALLTSDKLPACHTLPPLAAALKLMTTT